MVQVYTLAGIPYVWEGNCLVKALGTNHPKEGDTKQGAHGQLTLRHGRWRREGQAVGAAPLPNLQAAPTANIAAPLSPQTQTQPQGKFEEDYKHPKDITNPIHPSLPPEAKAKELMRLTRENQPIIADLIREIHATIGAPSKDNIKAEDRIVQKASRPSIRAEKPWHDVEHIRDSYRMKSSVSSFEQIAQIGELMAKKGIKLVKLDTKKMMEPKEWGWRMAAFDMRMPNGQLMEFYTPLQELEGVKHENHLLFEKWRNESKESIRSDPQRTAQYKADVKESYDRYDNAFSQALTRMGISSRDEAAQKWKDVEARLQSAFTSLQKALLRLRKGILSYTGNVARGGGQMTERVLVSDDNQRAWLMESDLLFDNGRWYKYGEEVFGPSDVYENFHSASPSEAAEWLKKAGIQPQG